MFQPVKLAIFDFDGTLTTGHLWVGLTRHHKARKIKRLSVYTYLIFHMPIWIAAKLKLYDDNKNKAKWGEDLSTLFKGFTKEQTGETFEWVMDNYFDPSMRKDLIGILNEHKKNGYKLIILSGMFKEFLEIIGKRLGADFVVGTELEIANGKYTGKIIQPLCFGKNKAVLLNRFIQENGVEVDWNQSYAYADSISDQFIFQLVGHPVASYPDKRLTTLAKSKQWRIIGKTTTTTNHL
jgi:HAD superfamily hydrolase (TIGR01490 family)